MTDTPDAPAPDAGAPGPDAVPAQPVVQIEIFGSTVSVNGVVIVHDGTQSLHHVAVHAAAERVAKVLGRPVRAQAIDAEGRATLVVHPDGHASDVELVETYDSEAEAVAATTVLPVPPTAPPAPPVAPAAGATAPVFSSFPDPDALPAGPPPDWAPAAATTALPVTADPAATQAATRAVPLAGGTGARPVAGGGAPSGWPSKVVRAIAVAAALVAVIGVGVLLLGTRSGDDDDRASDEPRGETSPVAASSTEPTPTPTPSSEPSAAAAPVVDVEPLGGINAVRLTITTDTVPGTAVVTLTPVSGPVVTRTVTLDQETTKVNIGKVAAGAATWQVAVQGAEPVTGDVTVSPPFVAPTPTPTPVAPVAPAAPAPAAPTTAAPSPAAPKPPSKPASKPASKPKSALGGKPKNTFKDKGQKGTTKGPSGPVDPDDRLTVLR